MALGPHEADPNRREELKRRERDVKEGRGAAWAALPDTPEWLPIDPSFYMRTAKTLGPIGGLEGTAERLMCALCERLGIVKGPRTSRYARPVVDELLKAAGGDEKRARAALDSPLTADRVSYFRGLMQL